MLRTRVLTAAVLAPIVLAVVLLGRAVAVAAASALVAFLALVELIALLDAAGFEPPQVLTLAGGMAVAGATLVAANGVGRSGLLLDVLHAAAEPPGCRW